MFGTAPRINNWLLIENSAPWSSKALPDDNFSSSIRKHLRSLQKSQPYWRSLMIRPLVRGSVDFQYFICVSDEAGSNYFSVRAENEDSLLSIGSDTVRGEGVIRCADAMYLVCTHGKHDKCCAKFGNPTYQMFKAIEQEQSWECSHVGGDRFAANVVCLPHGIYYGHVFPEDVSVIVESHRKGEIRLSHYRGRSCYSRLTQVGEYFIRWQSGICGIDHLRFVSTKALTDSIWESSFRCTRTQIIHQVTFEVNQSAFTEYLTCHADNRKAVDQYRLRTYLTRIAG